MNGSGQFAALRARYVLVVIIVAWYWQPGIDYLYFNLSSATWYWSYLLYHYYAHAVILLFLGGTVVASQLDVSQVHGRPIRKHDLLPSLYVVAVTFSASMALITLTFIPLSYVLPKFVTWWIGWWSEPIIYLHVNGDFPFWANLLSFISLVVLAPLLEEYLFRGYLLRRWIHKWGMWPGILLSSMAFGAIHPDTIGAAFTGIGFALLYLKTKSLWAPVLAHVVYNLLAWIWELVGIKIEGIDYYRFTLDQFQDGWWQGAIALVIAIFLIDRFLRLDTPLGVLALPADSRKSTKELDGQN